MLELTRIRQEKDAIISQLEQVRNFKAKEIIEEIISVDENRRSTQQTLDAKKSEMNAISKEIGKLFAQGKQEEANQMKNKTGELKEETQTLDQQLSDLEEQLNQLLYQVPNVPNPIVPKGKSDTDNEIVDTFGEATKKENALPHWDLASKYDLIDFELGVKVTGAGFPIYKGKGARLQRALINFFLDEASKAGYNEVIPPHMVNEDSGFGTGQLPDKEGQMYHATVDNLYLIPTAEVPVTNIYRNVILKEEDFPIKMTAYSPCFRREAGSYGKDVRGLNRLHQFDKVEIVRIEHPQNSYNVLDEMVKYVKGLLEKLNLPYRTLRLCGGDLGFTSALTYDLEVFSAAQDRWLEVSSVSNFETFQANRLKLRFNNKEGKKEFAHTLNGSALALPRIVAAILENNQTENGIKVPEVLVPYTGFDLIN